MAITLPPPVEPQLSAPTVLASQAVDETVVDYHGIHIHVFGHPRLDPELLRRVIPLQPSLSDAVRAVGALCYAAGYPGTIIRYGVTDHANLYVKEVQGHVESVQAPDDLLPYFRGLQGKTMLSDSALEERRALADGLSERAGHNYRMQVKPGEDDGLAVDLGAPLAGPHQFAVLGDLSNYGNRYSGHYLADLSLRQALSSGDEFQISGVTALRVLGLADGNAQPYHEGDGAWSRVSRFGVFGVQGNYASFGEAVQGFHFKGELSSGAASWMYPLYADFHQRVNVQVRVLRNQLAIRDPQNLPSDCTLLGDLLNLLGAQVCSAGGPVGDILSEAYNSVDATVSYAERIAVGTRQTELQAGLTLRKGLGHDHPVTTPANLGYFLLQPSLSVAYGISQHWSLQGEGLYQFSRSTLPQQQQFVLGGPTSLHAFESGAGLGDRGGNARVAVAWSGLNSAVTNLPALRIRAFSEYANATLSRSGGPLALADAGIDIDVRFLSWLGGTLSVADSVYQHNPQLSPDSLSRRTVFFKLGAKY